jgi:SAM-dependent methyltransferase
VTLRYHEIAETYHRILNPIDSDKLMLLGEVINLRPGMRILDLACGKGEMLTRWARTYGTGGVGVDISTVFLEAAKKRAEELAVESEVEFIQADAGAYVSEPAAYDIVSCIGATWIGGGMHGTLRLMRPSVKPDGLLLVGEPYWIEEPPDQAYDAFGVRRDDYCELAHILTRFKAAEVELVEMVLANQDTWDRYEAQVWLALSDFLRENPTHPDAHDLRQWGQNRQQVYLEYGRRYLGWGVFVLRPNWEN